MKGRLARLRSSIDPRLLPVIVLLVAALVAVPLFVRDSDTSIAVAGQPALPSETATAADGSGEAIVTLEDSGTAARGAERLGERQNPFKQNPKDDTEAKVEALAKGGADATSTTESGGGGGGGAEPEPEPEPSATPEPAGTPTATPTPTAEPDRGKTWTPVVRFVDQKSQSLERLGGLPSTRNPLLLYMGLAPQRERAVFLVAAGTTVVGEAGCWPAPDNCKQISLAAEDEIDLVAPTGQSSRLELRAIREREVSVDAARDARADVAPGGRMALRMMLDRVADLRYDERTGLLDGAVHVNR